eukprot:6671485-Alexandrium_andersonii.AAC.1
MVFRHDGGRSATGPGGVRVACAGPVHGRRVPAAALQHALCGDSPCSARAKRRSCRPSGVWGRG